MLQGRNEGADRPVESPEVCKGLREMRQALLAAPTTEFTSVQPSRRDAESALSMLKETGMHGNSQPGRTGGKDASSPLPRLHATEFPKQQHEAAEVTSRRLDAELQSDGQVAEHPPGLAACFLPAERE